MKKLILCIALGIISVAVVSCGDNPDTGSTSNITITGSGS